MLFVLSRGKHKAKVHGHLERGLLNLGRRTDRFAACYPFLDIVELPGSTKAEQILTVFW
jgi:hypothetical protein